MTDQSKLAQLADTSTASTLAVGGSARSFAKGGVVKPTTGMKVVRSDDDPYLAGESEDHRALYIDKRVPKKLTVKGKTFDPAKYLAVHESVERRHMDRGMKYQPAHRLALRAEQKAVEADGIDWRGYQEVMHRLASVTQREKSKGQHPPRDLYKGPFPPAEQKRLTKEGDKAPNVRSFEDGGPVEGDDDDTGVDNQVEERQPLTPDEMRARGITPLEPQEQQERQPLTPDEMRARGITPLEPEHEAPQPHSALEVGLRHAAKSVLPGIGSLAAMPIGAAAGAPLGPVGSLAGAFVGAGAANIALRGLQEKLLDALNLNEDPEQAKADVAAHPTAAAAGDILGSFAGASPQQAGVGLGARALMGAGQAGFEAAGQVAQGEDFDPTAIAVAGAAGFALPGLNRVGQKAFGAGERAIPSWQAHKRPGEPAPTETAPEATPTETQPPAEAQGSNMENMAKVAPTEEQPATNEIFGVRAPDEHAPAAEGNPDEKVGDKGRAQANPAVNEAGSPTLGTSVAKPPPSKKDNKIGSNNPPTTDRAEGAQSARQYQKTAGSNVEPNKAEAPPTLETLDPERANVTAAEEQALTGKAPEQSTQNTAAVTEPPDVADLRAKLAKVARDLGDENKARYIERMPQEDVASLRDTYDAFEAEAAKLQEEQPAPEPSNHEEASMVRARQRDEAAAREAMAKFPPAEHPGSNDIVERARNIVQHYDANSEHPDLNAAREALQKSVDKSLSPEDQAKWIARKLNNQKAGSGPSAAKDYIAAARKVATMKRPTPKALAEFAATEMLLREGGEEGAEIVRAENRAEGARANSGKQGGEEVYEPGRNEEDFMADYIDRKTHEAIQDHARLSENMQRLDHEHWTDENEKITPPASETEKAATKPNFANKAEQAAVERAETATEKVRGKRADTAAMPKPEEIKPFWNDERGAIDIDKLKGALIAHAKPLKDWIVRNLMPEMFSEKARMADPKFAKYNVQKVRMQEQFHKETDAEWYAFNQLPEYDQISFMTRYEAGKPQDAQWKNDVADRVKSMLDNAYQSELVWGSPAYFRDNYMPHIFENEAEFKRYNDFMAQQYGPRWFEKQRAFDTINEALAAGFKLKYTNPMEVVTQRLNASAHMQLLMNLLHELKSDGLAFPVREEPGSAKPTDAKEWKTIGAPNGTNWVLAPDVEYLWKNGVDSKGLWANEGPLGSAFRGWMKFKNATVFAKLGLSAFHQLHIGLGVLQTDNFARGFNFTGGSFQKKLGGGFAEMRKNLLDPFQAMNRRFVYGGKEVNTNFIGKTLETALNTPWEDKTPWQQEATKWFDRGGMKGTMSHEEMVNGQRAFAKAFEEQKFTKWLPAAVQATIQASMKPFFGEWIPNLKRASFYRSASAYFRLHPEHVDTPEGDLALRTIAKDVDDRYGEMFYSSRFWNRYAKDVGIGSFFSLGWQAGFVNQFGGAAYQLGRSAAAAIPGIGPRTGASALVHNVSSKGAYALSYFAVASLFAGAMSYALSGGQPPTTPMDYVFPRAGGQNPDGSPRRLSTMFYTREPTQLLAHREEANSTLGGLGRMVWNKMMFEPLTEAYHNRDFYGYQLYDPEANWFKQWAQMAGSILGEQFNPIAMSSATRAQQTGGGARDKALAFAGFGPAPSYVSKDALQNRISHLYYEGPGAGDKPYENKDRDQERRAARADFATAQQKGDTTAAADARNRLLKAGVNPKTIGREQYGSADVYQFSKLDPQVQKSLVARMDDKQFLKLVLGSSLVRGKGRVALIQEWQRLHPDKSLPSR